MRIITLLLLLTSPALAGPTVALVTDSRGFVHDVVKPIDGESVVVATLRGIVEDDLGGELRHVPDAADLDLEGVDVVAFYTTGDIPTDLDALTEFVRGGGGMLGVHCAADTLKQDERWRSLVGGVFESHPWNAGDTVTLQTHAPDFLAGRTLEEEVYAFRNFDPDGSQVLASLDMARTAKKRPEHVPVAWLRNVGDGRVAYTSLGHRRDVWEADWYQKHLASLVAWADGEGRPASPNPDLSQRLQAEAERAAAGESAEAERGWDPWVFRCVLDRRPRVVVVALADDLWAAWDATTCSLYKVWPGGMNFTGSVYDTRHGPQPQTDGDAIETFGEGEQWKQTTVGENVVRGGPVSPRWLGYRVDGTRSVTFRYAIGDISDPADPYAGDDGGNPYGGGGVEITETPEAAGPRSLRRTFEISGLNGHPVRVAVAAGGADVRVEGDGVKIVREQRGAGEVIYAEFTDDGTHAVTTTWPEEPTP